MERVLFFTGYRMAAFHWKGKKLAGKIDFDPGLGGHNKFDEYLKNTQNIPTRLLLDIIEEDFKRDVIPKIRGKDKLELVQRFESRLFRGAKYTAMLNQGKLKDNKFKEQALFSALTNPDILMPWMEMIEENQVPLMGIWSVPMMSDVVLPRLKTKTKHVLLISQQVPSSLRQSFFEDGQLVFSRQSKIKFDLREVNDAMSYAILLANEIEHTERYLTSHRLVGYDEKVSVCCLVRKEFEKDIQYYLEETEVLDYKIYSIQTIEKDFGFSEGSSVLSEVLFSRVCHTRPSTKDQYSKPVERRFFDEFRLNKSLYNGAFACVFIAALLTLSMVVDGIALEKEASEINSIVERVEQQYQEAYAEQESELLRATAMKSAVQLASAIKKDSVIQPMTFLLEFSKIVSKPQFSGLYVDSIEWVKELESKARVFDQREQDVDFDPYLMVEGEYIEDGGEQDNKVHLVIVKGRVPIGERPYRVTIAMINDFIHELEGNPLVTSVDIVDLPIDLRPSSSYSDQSGINHMLDKKDVTNEGFFSVRVVMKDNYRV